MRKVYENYYEDMHKALRYYEWVYGNKKSKKAALRVSIWNFLYLFQIKRKKKKKSSDKNMRIGFLLGGGYGDYLLFANWLWYFLGYLKDEKSEIDIYYNKASALTIFNFEIENVCFINANEQSPIEEEYDLFLEFCKYPQIQYLNKERVGDANSLVGKFVENYEEFYDENRIIIENKPFLDGLGSAKSITKGIKRIQEADIKSMFGITEEYIYPLRINEDEDAYLRQLGLEKKSYITIHRGWDSTYKESNVKGWSLESCGDLIEKIKEAYPEMKVVVFGASRTQAPDTTHADIDLVEKTSLEQVKVLVKHSKVHIDNEGGMVHLRHALHGGKSIVLFGPTSAELFGYSENVNLKSNVCSMWCEWLSLDWPHKCPKSEMGALCMNAITTRMILDELKGIM